jgi:hypothetical protein
MNGIQNKIIISQKTCIIHIYGSYNYKGKLIKVLSQYITFSVNFNMSSLDGTIFDLVSRSLKLILCYRRHSVPYAGFRALNVVDLNLVDSVVHITPQE